ncbi:lipoprotein ABC transporter ATP-binding protein [Arthrobacter sp. MYb211]|uniref:ABC transporter ATP-binding protein n=1 Tax=unclassified Arthrobacter TaxID=235627 RepID=UPI000CFA87DD|nr:MULTISPECIES: ATP-binding cassette domain-containing protein [unclassified Arthrobacter]PRA11948.1 lipoprotein ABC transporter ATP-binding protein [Arthrobacter sp. MYb221]PRC08303.1 lipoprotein ABC transporter ATP-binding protein [Arthrobacter sp. MYb211]
MSNILIWEATKKYGDRVLFENLSLEVPSGQLTALTGRSGSGKSTLLNCIGLLEDLNHGKIEIGGRSISRLNAERQRLFRRDALGYLFQDYALIENATINENLVVALAARGRAAVRSADFETALERVGLGGRGKELVYKLSGGEQQRIALARLVVKKPAVVLADEPTGALDAASSAMVLAELQRIAEEGAAVIVATHSKEVVQSCSGYISLD